MATKFRPAYEVEESAQEVIRDHHTHLLEHGVRIEYVFRNDVPVLKGRAVLGQARKISSLGAFLARDECDASPFFCIVVSEPAWDELNEAQRRALVDHELCHCDSYTDDKGKIRLATQGHDLEEFRAVVERHGLWDTDVQRFFATAATRSGLQLTLIDEVDPDESTQVTLSVNGRRATVTTEQLRQAAAGAQ